MKKEEIIDDVERNEFGDEFVVGCYQCGEDVNEVEENWAIIIFCKECNKY